jgi:hypothetical protein
VYEVRAEAMPLRETHEATPVEPSVPLAAETPTPAAPTRVWEAVQPTRPAPSLELISDDDTDELDVPAYLRKKSTDIS